MPNLLLLLALLSGAMIAVPRSSFKKMFMNRESGWMAAPKLAYGRRRRQGNHGWRVIPISSPDHQYARLALSALSVLLTKIQLNILMRDIFTGRKISH